MKFLIVFTLCILSSTNALFLGSKGGSKGGSNGGSAISYLPPVPVQGYAYNPSVGYPVSAAVYSTRQVEYVPVASQQYAPQPQLITVEPHAQPVQFLFKSQASPLQVRQVHLTSPYVNQGVQVFRSVEQPQVLRSEITKPVVHEVRETILPYRNRVVEIKPVLDHHRLIASGQPQQIQPFSTYLSPVGRRPLAPFLPKLSFFGSKGGKPDIEQQQEEQQTEETDQEDQQQEEVTPPIKGKY